jgi:CHAT domain-containing protein
VDRFTVRYGSTALADVRTRLSAGPVVAVEPPRTMTPPGAREEIDALRAVFGSRLTIVSDQDALRRQVRDAAIVHFATHAEANDEHPELARIAVPGGQEGRGADWLYAPSVGDWELDNALIVLSACESAAGALAGGQGTLSLSRAFLRAGAQGTVATLWPIGAPTAEFMNVFHAQLVAGARTEDALRTARLALRERHPLPVHWAAFTYTVR